VHDGPIGQLDTDEKQAAQTPEKTRGDETRFCEAKTRMPPVTAALKGKPSAQN
jgi:hypothetical protein